MFQNIMNCLGSTSHIPSRGIIVFKQLRILGLGKPRAYVDSHAGQSAVCSFPSGPREEGEEKGDPHLRHMLWVGARRCQILGNQDK